MASQDESAFHVSWPGIVALLVAALGMIVSRPSLDSPRPTPAATEGKVNALEKGMPARLWQDPLAAARRVPAPKDKIANVVSRRPKLIKADAQREAKVLFLFDCVESENSPEAAENRRRERYAVLSALNTAGYAPTQPDRIYFTALGAKAQPDAAAAGAGPAGPAVESTEDDRPIPYEWVEPLLDENGRLPTDTQYQAVCVLWVSQSPDNKEPLHRLASLSRQLKEALSRVRPKCEGKFAIAGRITSTQLATMLGEDASFDDPVTLYVTNSTAPSVRRKEPKAVNLKVNLKLEYVIDTDRVLADRLIVELGVRHIDLTQAGSVAIIAEWDTEYGREMHQVFDAATTEQKKETPLHYSYLRGLDGKELSGASGDQKGRPSSGGTEAGGGQQPTAQKPTAKEGEGEPQIDYLRRLARRMKEEETKNNSQLRAIGIVGNDVYDKLLLLRALRPVFPNAVFFTTDLDVRLLQPGDYLDTRNLVIASHYGLCLTEGLQGKVAPFRSSYDTASYLGCLRAVKYAPLQRQVDPDHDLIELRRIADPKMMCGDGKDENNKGCLLVPKGKDGMPIHVYEVGRSGAYELTLRATDPLGQENPRVRPWLLQVNHWLPLLGIVLIAGLLLYPVSRPWQQIVNGAINLVGALLAGRRSSAATPEHGSRDGVQTFFQVGVLLVGSLALLLLLPICYAHTREDQESFELYEGVSVWPTVILRLLASGLCCFYIAKALGALKKRNDELNEDFSIAFPTAKYPGFWAGLREICRTWTEPPPKDGRVTTLWQVFADHGVPWQRVFRTAVLAAPILVLYWLLFLLFDPTVVQARGWIAKCCYIVVLVLTVPTLAGLLMFVVDATLLSYRFVTALAGQRERKWPAKLLAESAKKWGLEVQFDQRPEVAEIWEAPRAVGQWLSIRLIDAVTYVVAAKLIYYPFVVLLVLVVAQNPLFDNWHWNTPLALTALFIAGVAVVCAVMLQGAAKDARSRALAALDELVRASGGQGDRVAPEKLAQIRTEIEDTNTGAFAGFSQNPVVRAVLLPLVGGGGLTALEAFLRYLANP
jgi:MFS family permease